MAYSGKFVLRAGPKLHQALALVARGQGLSLNELCQQILSRGLRKNTREPDWLRLVRSILPKLKKKFGTDLIGVLVFGSQVQGQAREGSDVDLLIVVSHELPLTRELYRWWEQTGRSNGQTELAPHFVHLPTEEDRAGSLWFEVALYHHIVYQQGQRLSRQLAELKQLIETGVMERRFGATHPYWVWREHAQP